MGHTVHSLFLPTFKGRERLLGWPGRRGRLLGRWRGLDEAAVESVLWIVVGYWERKTNAAAERSARGYCTILQEQQVCCHSLFNLRQRLTRWRLCGKVGDLYLCYMQHGLHRSGSFCVCWQGFTYMDPERYPQSCCLSDAAVIFVKFYCHVTTCKFLRFGDACVGGASVLFKQKGLGTDVNTKHWSVWYKNESHSQTERMNKELCLNFLFLIPPSVTMILCWLVSVGASCGFWGILKMIFTSAMKYTSLL